MTGFNLPPGCNVSDIPGNRPEDEIAEMIAEGWRPRCEDCGGFLRLTLEDREEDETYVEYRTCRRCGHENVEAAYPLHSPYHEAVAA